MKIIVGNGQDSGPSSSTVRQSASQVESCGRLKRLLVIVLRSGQCKPHPLVNSRAIINSFIIDDEK